MSFTDSAYNEALKLKAMGIYSLQEYSFFCLNHNLRSII